MPESQIVANDRAEEARRPGRRSTLAIAVEAGYDPEGSHAGCLAGARIGRHHPSHPGEPCPDDVWAGDQIQCERCEEYAEETYCTHGQTLCAECLHWCTGCNDERADQQAYDDGRDEL